MCGSLRRLSFGKPVLLYDLKCAGSQAYLKLASEVIQRERLLQAASEDRAMSDEISKNRLGRGLAALLGDVGAEATAEKRLKSQRVCRSSSCAQAR